MASNEMEVDDENETKPKNFHELELDDRILKVRYRTFLSSLKERLYFQCTSNCLL